MISGIYKITNKITNNFYIGSSKDIKARWRKHIRNSSNPNSKEYEYPICRAIRKYGKENFLFEVLEEVNTDDPAILIEKEQEHYDLLKPEYNQMRPDFVPTYNPTKEKREERSKMYSGEGNPFFGKKHSEETKKILSEHAKKRVGELNSFFGKKHTEETKRKIAVSNGKKVVGTDDQGREYYFDTAVDAGNWCKDLGLTKSKTPNSDILKVCKGHKKKAFTFYWRYG